MVGSGVSRRRKRPMADRAANGLLLNVTLNLIRFLSFVTGLQRTGVDDEDEVPRQTTSGRKEDEGLRIIINDGCNVGVY